MLYFCGKFNQLHNIIELLSGTLQTIFLPNKFRYSAKLMFFIFEGTDVIVYLNL